MALNILTFLTGRLALQGTRSTLLASRIEWRVRLVFLFEVLFRGQNARCEVELWRRRLRRSSGSVVELLRKPRLCSFGSYNKQAQTKKGIKKKIAAYVNWRGICATQFCHGAGKAAPFLAGR